MSSPHGKSAQFAHRGSAVEGSGTRMFQHPLAYLIGLEGVALMKAFAGEFERDFTLARLAEVRTLLDTAAVLGDGAEVPPMSSVDGYHGWAQTYDGPGNSIFGIEEPVVHPILDLLPVGVAVDVACGTGRHAAYLARLGHAVSGFDTSPEMLAVARRKVPEVSFTEADARSMPLADSSVDTVVCALALAHVEDLGPVFAEFARVLRPGGHLVISDTRGQFIGSRLYPIVDVTPNGDYAYIPAWRHSTSEYIRTALDHRFLIRDCHEPVKQPEADLDCEPLLPEDPAAPPSIWDLHTWVPEATNAAHLDQPALIIWHFQLGNDGS
jgi:SAM-dependent methyltransferase